MKNKIKILLSISFLLFILTSCNLPFFQNDTTEKITITENKTDHSITVDDSNINENGYNVIFECDNGYRIITKTNLSNKINKPSNPTKDFATFKGWYYNNQEFNFNNTINKDVTLIAKWDLDYEGLVNYFYKNTIKANIKVITTSYNYSTTFGYSQSTSSGIIFNSDSNYYYALTNNHSVAKASDKNNVMHEVVDAYGNTYETGVLCNDLTYDLAVIKFTKSTKKPLDIIKFASYDSFIGQKLISVGNPNSLNNTILFGNTKSYKTIVPDSSSLDSSNVQFEVLAHTCEIEHGSSGGAVLDTSFNLVGINFASVDYTSGEFYEGYAIPLSKINEFLHEYLY